MIDAKELRIGNLVEHSGKIVRVGNIAEVGINFNGNVWEQSTNKIQPIPLTEEWLLKFGFKYNGWNWEFNQFKFHAQGKNDKGEFYNTEFYIQSKKEWILISFTIDFVHQLQNLYFALTGTELTIK